jgi:hypothetical protein
MSWEIIRKAFLQLLSSPLGIGLIVAGGGWLLGKYIYGRRESKMLVEVFYISTGVLAFVASSWLAYGFYYSLYEPKEDMPVEKWLLPLDAIDKFLPADLVRDWHTKMETETRLNKERNEVVITINQKSKPPPNISPDAELLGLEDKKTTLELELGEAQTQRTDAENRVREQLIAALVTGKLIAHGIPTGTGPGENEQVTIKPAQWQYLNFQYVHAHQGFYAARDFRTADNNIGYDGLEIGKPH